MRSLFVTTRDGTRLAVDVHLPRHRAGDRLPTILRQTRYMRSLAPNGALSRLLGVPGFFDVQRGLRARFLRAGYAWVDADVRGTGASGGFWRGPWFEDQRRDGYDLIAWIASQPWSNGRVGATGISYDGTCADMLLAEPHPALRAVAPLFCLYDIFPDVAFPGGVHLAWFTAAWSAFNAALDRNEHARAMTTPVWLMARAAATKPDRRGVDHVLAALGRLPEARFRALFSKLVRAAIRGVADVERAGDGIPTEDGLRERARNLDVHAATSMLRHRDDAGVDPERPELTIDALSPHRYREAQRASGAAIYSYSGWRDGAYPHSAIKRFLTVDTPGSRLTLGPWAHTGQLAIHAFATGVPSQFDHGGELVAFFDEHLREGCAGRQQARVRYFTTGVERWQAASTWPPPGLSTTTLHLSPGALAAEPARASRAQEHAFGPHIGSGERSRFRSLLSLVPGDYPDRRARDAALLTYDSPPLREALEVTGHPIVSLFAAWEPCDDASVFAYLEDLAPDGALWYVSEGQLAARHRKVADRGEVATPGVPRSFLRRDALPLHPGQVVELQFDLLPFSHVFGLGHRLRLALAGCDADHFVRPLPGTLFLHTGPTTPSRLTLPTRGMARFTGGGYVQSTRLLDK